MNLAFCLFNYFPFGGLQRDCKRIAKACAERGHSVQIFTMSWEGDLPSDFTVSLVPVQWVSNHRRCFQFARKASAVIRKKPFDAVVGFNKMPGLDVYYAADPCYKANAMDQKSLLYRLTPRYRLYARLERTVFDPSADTRIILISPREKERFRKWYHTQEERFHFLPPGISEDRRPPPHAAELRDSVRAELLLAADEFMLLMVGSAFKTKGLDRSLLAIAGLPEGLRKNVRLFVIGRGDAGPFERVARKHGVRQNLHFLGAREDVTRFLVAADLLIHPAYSENTGTVLIEAMACGLPVLAADICGYAPYVEESGAGFLIPSPFTVSVFADLIERMLTSPERRNWSRRGMEYVSRMDKAAVSERAADIIEQVAREKTCGR